MLAWRLLRGYAGSAFTMPIYDYIVAASDTATALKASATATCDGTGDEVEINAAIAAAVAAARPYSILLLPGTYSISAKVDFTPLTAVTSWILFEASASLIRAGASMTTMIDLAPGAGGQIVTCLDARFGVLDGNKASYTTSQIINMARFNDNRLRVNDLIQGSGHGLNVQQAGVSDYPCGNNQIEFNTIRNCGGTAIQATGGTNNYGFQGNVVRFGDIIANNQGITMGLSVNQNARLNTFVGSPIEYNTAYGIYDSCGGNMFFVNNTNSNGTKGIGCPGGMTYKSTFIVNIDDSTDASVLSQHFVLSYGRSIGQI